ncbi:MAG: hypothetical protein EOO59_19865, partial [Hymenobacter sp.]
MRARFLFGWRRLGGLLLALLVGLLGLGAACAQVPAGAAATFALTHHGRHQTRFDYIAQRNLVIVAARLNGQGPYNFLLDTGVGTSLLTDPQVASELHLSRGEEYHMMGVGGADSGLRAYEATNVRVTLPGAEAAGMSWLVLSSDVLDLSGYVGMPIHGIMGADLFRSFVVIIHPDQHQLVLTDPARYKA